MGVSYVTPPTTEVHAAIPRQVLGTPLLQPPGDPTKFGLEPHVIPVDCPGSVVPTWVAQISTALLDEGGAGISDMVPPPLDELVDELAPELELELELEPDAPLLEEDDELPELDDELDEELVDPPEDVELLEEPEPPELLAAAPPLLDPPPHPARTVARSKAPASDTFEGLPHAGRTRGTPFEMLSPMLGSSRNANVRRDPPPWLVGCSITSSDWTFTTVCRNRTR